MQCFLQNAHNWEENYEKNVNFWTLQKGGLIVHFEQEIFEN